jgi:hypothetical protein
VALYFEGGLTVISDGGELSSSFFDSTLIPPLPAEQGVREVVLRFRSVFLHQESLPNSMRHQEARGRKVLRKNHPPSYRTCPFQPTSFLKGEWSRAGMPVRRAPQVSYGAEGHGRRMNQVNLYPEKFHGEWNYVMKPHRVRTVIITLPLLVYGSLGTVRMGSSLF